MVEWLRYARTLGSVADLKEVLMIYQGFWNYSVQGISISEFNRST